MTFARLGGSWLVGWLGGSGSFILRGRNIVRERERDPFSLETHLRLTRRTAERELIIQRGALLANQIIIVQLIAQPVLEVLCNRWQLQIQDNNALELITLQGSARRGLRAG